MVIRLRDRLPSIDRKPTFLADRAIVDRFDIRFEKQPIAFPDEASFARFLVAAKDSELFEVKNASNPSLIIRDRWLAAGAVKFFREAGGQLSIEVTLTLNATRYWVHSKDRASSDPAFALRLNLGSRETTGNSIPAGHYSQAFGVSWPALSQDLLERVLLLIANELTRIRSTVPGWRSRGAWRFSWLNWYLKRIEVYWEFSHPNLLGYLTELEHLLRQRRHALESTVRLGSATTSALEGDNLEVKTTFARRGEIVFYGKDKNRLRIEVRHFGDWRRAYAKNRKALPSRTTNDLRAIVSFLIDRARWQVAHVFEHAPATEVIHPRLHRLAMTLARIATASGGDMAVTTRMIELLVQNERVTLDEDFGTLTSSVHTAIRTLIREGVLRPERSGPRARKKVYRLIALDAAALAAVRSALPSITPVGALEPADQSHPSISRRTSRQP